MRKIYLSVLALSVSLFAGAQLTTTSFEDYTEGAINGQNGWTVMAQTQTALIDPLPAEISNLISVTSAKASDGAKSIAISKDDGSLADANGAAYFAFNTFTLPTSGTHEISFDLRYENDGDGSGQIQVTFDAIDLTTFNETPQGGFLIANNQGNGFLGFMEPGATQVQGGPLPFAEWVNVSITYNLDEQTAVYKVEGQEVGISIGTTDIPNAITLINFGASNTAYIDNFKITDATSSIAINTKDIKVFPNPAKNLVNFQVDGLENGNVVISSITGQVVVNTTISGTAKVDVSNLNNGVYIYKVVDANGEVVKTNKLVINK